nr:integrase, catalytic region, zinc finger, CCHC-type, peptidase aspartic, catalytic [Tanacetum cinerariifolium]
MTLVKQSQELKNVSYHKLYDILKQHQYEVNEIRAKKIARVANPLALVAQQQPVYHPQTHPTHYNQNSSTRSQQATRNKGKAIVNSPRSIYDQESSMVVDDDDDDETSKDKEIDKLMALISLSFKKIYKPTNNNLRTSSNTSRANQDNSPRIHRNAGYEHQRLGNVAGARETVGSTVVPKSGIQYYNCKEHGHVAREYVVDSGPIFDTEPEQKVQNDDHYDVFTIECQHTEQSEFVHKTYLNEQDAHNVIIESVHMQYDSEQIDQNDEDADLAKERELLASLIEKLKCEIDETKNHNTLLETSTKVLVEKLKGEIEDFKNKNKSLTEANNKLSKENDLLFADFKKSKAELKSRDSIEYATEMELECAKVRDAQIKLYKSCEDKEIEKVIDLENKVKVLDNIVYKTGQSVQTMHMLNNKCRTSFAKPKFLKKAKQANPRLYDIGCYNDNLALMLSPESDEVIRLEKESRSKLSDLVRPFDYAKLNSLYDLFVSQRKKSSEQRFFSERSRISHINVQNEKKKVSFQKQTTFLEKRMDESIPMNKNCQSSLEIVNIQMSINTIITGVELCKQKIANRTYFGHIDPFIQNTIEQNFCPVINSLTSQLETQKTQFVNEIDRLSREYYYADHMNAILGVYTELDEDLKAQLQDKGIVISELKKLIEKLKGKSVDTKFEKSSVIRQPNAFKSQRPSVLGKPATFSNSFTLPTNKKSCLKNTNVLAPGIYELYTDHTQARTSKLPQDSKKTNKRVSFSTGVIPTTSVSRPQLKSNSQGDRVMHNNSQGKKKEVEDHRRSVKLSKNKTSVTACNDNLNVKTLNEKSVSAMFDKCVLIDKHDMCVLKSVDKPLKKTVALESNNKPRNFTRKPYEHLIEIVLFIVDSGCSKHMTGNLKLLINFVEKFLGTVKFRNDYIAPILGYGDLVQGAVMIKRVYYVKGLNHNLFSVGQFRDADFEVAFRKSTCFIRDLKGNDLLTGSRGTDLYSITLQVTNSPNPICLMAKATSSQAWLWHHRLSHLNFDTINLLLKNDIVTLRAYFAAEGIQHQTSVARTPEQNGIVERRNRTLVEAARTMLSAAKVPLFFWAEAIATACFT